MHGFKVLFSICLVAVLSTSIEPAKADAPGYIGVVLQESVGAGKTLTDAGHLTLIATHLCADGIMKVRRCAENEPQGVILGRYSRLFSNLDMDWMALPMTVALMGASDYVDSPLISTELINQAMELKYWREELRNIVPGLSNDEYAALEKKKEKITAGKIAGDALIIGLIIHGMDRGQAAEQSVAINDSKTNQLVPAGRWMESVGIREHRGAVILMVQSTEEQEGRLMTYLNGLPNDHSRFKDVGANCADFGREALSAAFKDQKIAFPSKISDPADVFGLITSPIMVTKGLFNHAVKHGLDYQILLAPQLAGTTSSSTMPRTLARGILLPDASQGKVSFLMKLIITQLNYLIPASALVADVASRPINLDKRVHEKPEELNQIEPNQSAKSAVSAESAEKRVEQIRVFGTDRCWKAAEQEYAGVIQQAKDNRLLTDQESRKFARSTPAKVTVQWLEAQGLTAEYDEQNQLRVRLGQEVSGVTRRNLLDYRQSPDRLSSTLAFKLAAAAIHYDLATQPLNRRQGGEFDADWRLFSGTAKDNGLKVDESASVTQCSLAELARNPEARDSFETAMSVRSTFVRSLESLFHLRW